MSRRLAAVVSAALASLAFPAAAQTIEAPAPGIRRHDGFYLNLQTGPAYLALSQDSADMTISGTGYGLNVAVGGSPVENLVIFGEVISQVALGPTLEVGGEEYESDDSVSLSFAHIGPGLAYYFGESSFFLSGSVGLAQAALESNVGKSGAQGVGLRLGAGKEWWVGDQWGLGVGANFFTASMTDDSNEEIELGATSFALNFSATFH